MIEHAAAQFRLGRRRKDGSTERDHLLAVQRVTGKQPPELQVPPLPPGTADLWGTYLQIRNSCAAGLGPAVMTQQDVLAWQQLHGVRLLPWEIDTLFAIDVAARAAATTDGTDHKATQH